MAKWEGSGGDKNFYSFKGHGAIRDAADVAVMLKRDRLNSPDVMDFGVVKHRHGAFKGIEMSFDLKTGVLRDLNEMEAEDEQD
jgi:replicative DNA helicase